MKNITIEICCGSPMDAILAEEAGADRVELNASLEAGGLTPSYGAFFETIESVKIPVVCMVRPRAGGFCYSESELAVMLRDAEFFVKNGAAGVAFGALLPDGSADLDFCRRLVRAIGGGQAVFHRAFDSTTSDALAMTAGLADAGVARILTSGRRTDALTGAGLIAECAASCPQIEFLPGGGVRSFNAAEIIKITGCKQLHFSCHRYLGEPCAARNTELSFDCSAPKVPCSYGIIDREKLTGEIRKIKAV